MKLNLLKTYFTFLSAIFSFPYFLQWKPCSEEFQLNLLFKPSSRQSRNWKVINIHILGGLYAPYLVSLLFTHLPQYIESNDFLRVAFVILWNVPSFVTCLTQSIHFFAPKTVVMLVNGTENFLSGVRAQHFPNSQLFSKSRRLRLLFMVISSGYSILFLVVVLPLFVLFEGESWMLSGFLYRLIIRFGTDKTRYLAVVVALIIDSIWTLHVWGATLLTIHICFLFLHTFKTTIEATLEKVGQKGRRGVPEAVLIYRKLQILTRLFNGVYGRYFITPFQLMNGFCTVMASLFIVRLHVYGVIILVFGGVLLVLSVVMAVVLILFLAMPHEYSRKLKNCLTTRQNLNPSERKLVRSVKTESVRSGIFFDVKRITCFNYLGMCGNVTGSALISFKG